MASKINFARADPLADHERVWSHLSAHIRGLASLRGPLSVEEVDSRDWRATILRWTQRVDVQFAHPREALLGLRAAIADMASEEAAMLVLELAQPSTPDDAPNDPLPPAAAAGTRSSRRSA